MQALLQVFSGLGRTAMEALIPQRCVACRALYRRPESGVAQNAAVEGWQHTEHTLSAFLCHPCAKTVRWIVSPLCTTCGTPFAADQGVDHECRHCIEEPPAFRKARSVGYYEGGLRKLIHHLKYKGFAQAAAPLGCLLWEVIEDHWQDTRMDRIIPVPLHSSRLRRRGFNQSLQFMRSWGALAQSRGKDFEIERIATEVLVRRHNTLPQAGLNSKQRITNVKRAFKVKTPLVVKDQNVLLVDDVFTTGATVNACARELMRAGAAEVHVVTLARSV